MNISQLASIYDLLKIPIICTAKPPTKKSVKKIEEHFDCSLPKGLVQFAEKSKNYGNWLASIGMDYDSPTHIIQINNYWQQNYQIPKKYIAINIGYDDDVDCIDVETYNPNNGEYMIVYWYPGIKPNEGKIYENFYSYMSAQVKSWRE